jgi:ubiquinone/menaquinone biosynthesis C-methylase UbiE
MRRQFNSLGKRLRLQKPRVLDLACGDGAFLGNLCGDNKDLVGLDLSETMLVLAKARCKNPQISLVQGDAQRLPFASRSFDACHCSFCFANIGYPRHVVEEMARVLRTGGLMAITDVVAVGPREHYQVNCLERARQPYNTRILELKNFIVLFDALPLRWRRFALAHESVDFRRWISGSNLRPGSPAFRSAKTAFQQAVLHQQGAGLHKPRHYTYSVARLLLERTI